MRIVYFMPRIRAAVRCRSGIYRRAYPRLCLFLAAVYVGAMDHRGSVLLVSAGAPLAVGRGYPAAVAAGQSADLDPDPLF